MTATPPPLDPLRRDAVLFAVLMGDDQGSFPTSATTDRVYDLLLQSVHLGCNGNDLPTMTFDVDLSAAGLRYQDTTVPIAHNRIIEVRPIKPNGTLGECLCWGKVASQGQALGKYQERLSLVCRVDWFLLGGRFEGYQAAEWKLGQEPVTINSELTFNPVIDDTVEPNRSNQKDSDHGDSYYVAEPESFRRGPAQEMELGNGAYRARWSIAEAVHRVLWSLNPDEDYLTNPSLDDLRNDIKDDRDDLFKDVTIKLGATLPEALDAVLLPFGFMWCLTWSGAVGDVETTLKIMRRGEGIEEPLLAQRIGEAIQSDRTNVADLQVEYDIVSNPNVVIGMSGLNELEVSVPLFPAWDNQYDNKEWASIYLGQTPAEVGRKWVAGEGGGYHNVRTGNPFDSKVPNLFHEVFQKVLTRRRKPMPQLTRVEDDTEGDNGFKLTWAKDGSAVNFKWSWSVLEQELGIWIEGTPAEEFWNAFRNDPTGIGMKLNCTVQLDQRFIYRAERSENSPNGSDVPLLLDLSEKFKRRLVHGGSADVDSDTVSYWYNERHVKLTEVIKGDAGAAQLRVDTDIQGILKVGDRVAVLANYVDNSSSEPTGCSAEGRYTVADIDGSGFLITVREKITDSIALDNDGIAMVGLNTDEDECAYRLTKYVDDVLAEQDYAVVSVKATLSGVDHPQYERGKIVPKVDGRNITFDAYTGAEHRRPQIVGLTYDFAGGQRTVLHLEQLHWSRTELEAANAAS